MPVGSRPREALRGAGESAADIQPLVPPPARIAARGIAVRYGDRTALSNLTFAVQPGEIFGLLGPNGAGKSTAFHVLVGLVAPAAGEIEVDGVPSRPGDPSLRIRTGVVFQQPSLDLRLGARQNLKLAAALHRVPAALARERIARLLALAELADRADEPVSRYSGGMRRRLEICRALVHDPEILVLDEPTTGLDEAAFQRTWRELASLREERGLTLLVTTHRPDEGERCDRVAILDRGEIIACDTPVRLKARVSGDVLVIDADDPDEVRARIRAQLGLETRLSRGLVFLEHPRGHELIPRLVESFPQGRLRSVNLHRPSLGDVFLGLTGRALSEPGEGI
jgi:ABC-2 type transport system ATP-binding protein